MSLLEFVKKEEATGAIAEIYKSIEDRAQFLPNVVSFHTASPDLFPKYMQIVDHFINHEVFEPKTVSYIRLMISNLFGGKYCVQLQSAILKSFGVPEEDVELAVNKPYEINLEPEPKAMVLFVYDLVQDKLENKEDRINQLRNLGFTDKDIYEATIIGTLQQAMVNIIKTFEVEPEFWMKMD